MLTIQERSRASDGQPVLHPSRDTDHIMRARPGTRTIRSMTFPRLQGLASRFSVHASCATTWITVLMVSIKLRSWNPTLGVRATYFVQVACEFYNLLSALRLATCCRQDYRARP